MELTLRATENGMSLVVKKYVDEHNHQLSWVITCFDILNEQHNCMYNTSAISS